MIDEILAYNKQFVANKEYEPFITDKYPRRKTAILTCMDTRLTTLLPAALGLRNGCVKMIKNAGAVVHDPYGSEIRSLLVAICELDVEDIMVIGHTDCGASHMNAEIIFRELYKKGIEPSTIENIRKSEGVNFEEWLAGFGDVEQNVIETINFLRQHPLIPESIRIRGFVMDSVTGALKEVTVTSDAE